MIRIAMAPPPILYLNLREKIATGSYLDKTYCKSPPTNISYINRQYVTRKPLIEGDQLSEFCGILRIKDTQPILPLADTVE